ncbi:MAG: hypothetical protein ACLFNM_01390 [Candidatus Woesearchaeota archaeon]
MVKIIFKTSFALVEGFLHLDYDQNFLDSKLLFLNDLLLSKQNELIFKLHELTDLDSKHTFYEFWLIAGKYPSSPRPNLLNVNQDDSKILFDFCCLLTHNLFFENDFYDLFLSEYGINETRLEATVYFVAQELLLILLSSKDVDNLFLELKKDLFSKYLWDELDFLKTKGLTFPLQKVFFENLY